MRARMGLLAAGFGVLSMMGCASSHVPVGGIEASHPSLDPDRSDPRALVLRDGDTIDVTTDIVSVPGKPVRLCAPVPVAAPGSIEPPAPGYCEIGLDATGIDLGKLHGRFAKDGAVEGTAHVRGIVRGGAVTVTQQSAAAIPDAPLPPPDQPPCPAPSGGWAVSGQQVNLDTDAVDSYKAAHPDAIADYAMLRPSDDQVLMYVQTTGDPTPVRRALTAAYPDKLCVVRAKFQPDVVTAAIAHIKPFSDQPGGLVYSYGQGLGPTGDDDVDVDIAYLTDQVVDAIAKDPPGLVVFNAWITPVR